jgi:nucleoid-associated protein YgaU
LVLVSAAAFGQSLLDDPQYRRLIDRMEELQSQAEQAVEDGRYDRAIELGDEAQEVAAEAEEYAEQRVLAFRANGWLNRARERYATAARYDAEERYPEQWDLASGHLQEANDTFTAANYTESIEASRRVISTLEVVEPPAMAEEEPEPEPESAELPRYYTVRLIPENRDSFWKIAGYDFVYGDPFKWPVLYEANRDVLRNPDNPDLIHPGMRFIIPSIEGEERGGDWQPSENR